MKVVINLPKEFIRILENHGSYVYSNEEPKYFFLPFWFEKTGDEEVYQMHQLGALPKELLDNLNFMRDGDSEEPLKQY